MCDVSVDVYIYILYILYDLPNCDVPGTYLICPAVQGDYFTHNIPGNFQVTYGISMIYRLA